MKRPPARDHRVVLPEREVVELDLAARAGRREHGLLGAVEGDGGDAPGVARVDGRDDLARGVVERDRAVVVRQKQQVHVVEDGHGRAAAAPALACGEVIVGPDVRLGGPRREALIEQEGKK